MRHINCKYPIAFAPIAAHIERIGGYEELRTKAKAAYGRDWLKLSMMVNVIDQGHVPMDMDPDEHLLPKVQFLLDAGIIEMLAAL